MKSTYKAVEVSAPGMLRVVERQVSEPGPGQLRIRVEACGICHTDAATVMGAYPGLTLPKRWVQACPGGKSVNVSVLA
jgi:alcohol dehydrogenase